MKILFRNEDDKVLRRVVARCHMGDWFLLTMVKRNLDDRQFTSWIKEVEESICEKESVRREKNIDKETLNTKQYEEMKQ